MKVTIMFRGRELAHPEFGREILTKVVEASKDIIQEEVNAAAARLEGRNMSILLSPSSKVLLARPAAQPKLADSPEE